MNISLVNEDVFVDNAINFDKKINFVFGKNGTGKSTIVKLIKEQVQDYDIRIFQGFGGILDENKQLNAVVLGKANSLINSQIEQKIDEVKALELEKKAIWEEISRPENSEENFWTRLEIAKDAFNNKESEIRNFRTSAAATIKRETNPQLSAPNYDVRNFTSEIEKACLLQDTEITELKTVLKSETKTAVLIKLPIIDFESYLKNTNEILSNKVKEKVKIARIENNEEKRKFAENGLQCHEKGDICVFCGNKIEDDIFTELESYFSADEVKKAQERINESITKIDKLLLGLDRIEIKSENFYPEFFERVTQLKIEIENLLITYRNFFAQLKKALQNKISSLFLESELLKLETPSKVDEIQKRYDDLLSENNRSDLSKNQKVARENLRFHKIKTLLDEFDYKVKIHDLSNLKIEKAKALSALNNEKNKIEGVDGLNIKINNIQIEINKLRAKTKDEKKLAQIINTKLKHFVSCELDHYENDGGKGFYRVKCLRSGSYRDIKKLSTGEKNIIAFLYFIEKLNEINENEENPQKKVIVFDDPMNSNDDTMQYLLIDALQNLMKEMKTDDKMVLLTHNNHFYLNVKYGRKYDKDKFIRFVSNGCKTSFKYLTKGEEDFKTNYEALWNEVLFLFNEENTSPEMLLNPIRRIIETYTKFNEISKNTFYESQSGAKKLFDVNSHSIDDLEADLNGKTKNDIISLMKQCFIENNSIEHFNKHWMTE